MTVRAVVPWSRSFADRSLHADNGPCPRQCPAGKPAGKVAVAVSHRVSQLYKAHRARLTAQLAKSSPTSPGIFGKIAQFIQNLILACCGVGLLYLAADAALAYLPELRKLIRSKKAGRRQPRNPTAASSAAAIAQRMAAAAALRDALGSESVHRLSAAIKLAEEAGVEKPLLKKAKNGLHALRKRRVATGQPPERKPVRSPVPSSSPKALAPGPSHAPSFTASHHDHDSLTDADFVPVTKHHASRSERTSHAPTVLHATGAPPPAPARYPCTTPNPVPSPSPSPSAQPQPQPQPEPEPRPSSVPKSPTKAASTAARTPKKERTPSPVSSPTERAQHAADPKSASPLRATPPQHIPPPPPPAPEPPAPEPLAGALAQAADSPMGEAQRRHSEPPIILPSASPSKRTPTIVSVKASPPSPGRSAAGAQSQAPTTSPKSASSPGASKPAVRRSTSAPKVVTVRGATSNRVSDSPVSPASQASAERARLAAERALGKPLSRPPSKQPSPDTTPPPSLLPPVRRNSDISSELASPVGSAASVNTPTSFLHSAAATVVFNESVHLSASPRTPQSSHRPGLAAATPAELEMALNASGSGLAYAGSGGSAQSSTAILNLGWSGGKDASVAEAWQAAAPGSHRPGLTDVLNNNAYAHAQILSNLQSNSLPRSVAALAQPVSRQTSAGSNNGGSFPAGPTFAGLGIYGSTAFSPDTSLMAHVIQAEQSLATTASSGNISNPGITVTGALERNQDMLSTVQQIWSKPEVPPSSGFSAAAPAFAPIPVANPAMWTPGVQGLAAAQIEAEREIQRRIAIAEVAAKLKDPGSLSELGFHET